MEGFMLLLGHLVGDYIVQNDWMAKNKVNPFPVVGPGELSDTVKYWNDVAYWWEGHLACFVHCLLYSLAVWACTFWWMPWWGLLLCFTIHFPIDRWRLAALWMKYCSGQAFFASKEHPMFPWSIVMVDNIFHLATLAGIALLAGR